MGGGLIYLVLIAVGLGLAFWSPDSSLADNASDAASGVVSALTDIVERGRRLTTATVSGGAVQESPDDLATAASAVVGRPVTTDAYSIARMVRSEEGAASPTARDYLVHVACNQAAALGWSLTQLMTFHTSSARAGRYGQQITGRFATTEDPYESDLQVAEFAISEHDAGGDTTGGALNFCDARSFGRQAGSTTFADFRATLAAEGKVPGRLPDAPSSLVFFWRGSVPDFAEAVS